MRTIALLAITAMIAAAETPTKPALNNAEGIALRSVVTESKKLGDQQNELKKQYEAIMSDACTRVFSTPVCKLNDDGSLSKIEAPKAEAAKK
jgi:hypothetical protein